MMLQGEHGKVKMVSPKSIHNEGETAQLVIKQTIFFVHSFLSAILWTYITSTMDMSDGSDSGYCQET